MMKALRILLVPMVTLAAAPGVPAQADLNDLEMVHVAVTASDIDIAYAHLALAFSESPAVREFAQSMISGHTAINAQVAVLAEQLGVEAQDNAVSRQLLAEAARIKNEMSRLRGTELDRYYATSELRYHRAVNALVADAFIPNLENAEVKRAFEGALAVFRGHERHAEHLVSQVTARGR